VRDGRPPRRYALAGQKLMELVYPGWQPDSWYTSPWHPEALVKLFGAVRYDPQDEKSFGVGVSGLLQGKHDEAVAFILANAALTVLTQAQPLQVHHVGIWHRSEEDFLVALATAGAEAIRCDQEDHWRFYVPMTVGGYVEHAFFYSDLTKQTGDYHIDVVAPQGAGNFLTLMSVVTGGDLEVWPDSPTNQPQGCVTIRGEGDNSPLRVMARTEDWTPMATSR
jgi:hypothetical protein